MSELIKEQARSFEQPIGLEANFVSEEVLISGNHHEINKALIERLVSMKTELLKEKNEKHVFCLQKETLKGENQKLQSQIKLGNQIMNQTKQMQIKRFKVFADKIKAALEISPDSEQKQIENEIQRLKKIQQGKVANQEQNRVGRLSKEVSDIILENFRTSKLLEKTNIHIKSLQTNQEQYSAKLPETINATMPLIKQRKLSVRKQIHQFIVPYIAPILLKSKSIESTAKVQPRNDQLHESLKQKDKLKFQIQQLKKQAKTLKERYNSRQVLIADAQIKTATLQETINFLRQELKRNDDKINDLKAKMEMKENQIQLLMEDHRVKTTEIQNEVNQLNQLRDTLLKRDKRISQLESTIQEKEKEREREKEREKERQKEKQKQKLNKKQQQSSKLVSTYKLLDQSSIKVAKLEKSIQFLENRLTQNRNEKEKYMKQNNEYKASNKQLSQKVQELKKLLTVKQEQNSSLKQKCQIFENQLAEIKIKTQQQINLLQHKIELIHNQYIMKNEELRSVQRLLVQKQQQLEIKRSKKLAQLGDIGVPNFNNSTQIQNNNELTIKHQQQQIQTQLNDSLQPTLTQPNQSPVNNDQISNDQQIHKTQNQAQINEQQRKQGNQDGNENQREELNQQINTQSNQTNEPLNQIIQADLSNCDKLTMQIPVTHPYLEYNQKLNIEQSRVQIPAAKYFMPDQNNNNMSEQDKQTPQIHEYLQNQAEQNSQQRQQQSHHSDLTNYSQFNNNQNEVNQHADKFSKQQQPQQNIGSVNQSEQVEENNEEIRQPPAISLIPQESSSPTLPIHTIEHQPMPTQTQTITLQKSEELASKKNSKSLLMNLMSDMFTSQKQTN